MMAFNPVFWILVLVFALALVGLTRLFKRLRGTTP